MQSRMKKKMEKRKNIVPGNKKNNKLQGVKQQQGQQPSNPDADILDNHRAWLLRYTS